MTLLVRILKKIQNTQNNNLRNEKIIQIFETRSKSIATAQKTEKNKDLALKNVTESEIIILLNLQQREFKDTHKIPTNNVNGDQELGNDIACLNPFLKNDLIRVGGRL